MHYAMPGMRATRRRLQREARSGKKWTGVFQIPMKKNPQENAFFAGTSPPPVTREMLAAQQAARSIPSQCEPGEFPCGPNGFCCPAGSCEERAGHWGCTGGLKPKPKPGASGKQVRGISLRDATGLRRRRLRNPPDSVSKSFTRKNPSQPKGISLGKRQRVRGIT